MNTAINHPPPSPDAWYRNARAWIREMSSPGLGRFGTSVWAEDAWRGTDGSPRTTDSDRQGPAELAVRGCPTGLGALAVGDAVGRGCAGGGPRNVGLRPLLHTARDAAVHGQYALPLVGPVRLRGRTDPRSDPVAPGDRAIPRATGGARCGSGHGVRCLSPRAAARLGPLVPGQPRHRGRGRAGGVAPRLPADHRAPHTVRRRRAARRSSEPGGRS